MGEKDSNTAPETKSFEKSGSTKLGSEKPSVSPSNSVPPPPPYQSSKK